MLPRSRKKSLNNGIVIPAKLRFWNECSKEKRCDRCNIQVNGSKEFEAILEELKRQPPNEFGYMLQYFKE